MRLYDGKEKERRIIPGEEISRKRGESGTEVK
jgi:hypothetical protein